MFSLFVDGHDRNAETRKWKQQIINSTKQCKTMALWKISAKGNWNWGPNKNLVKGMFVEMSTASTSPPLGLVKYQETIAQAFNTKYSTKFDKSKMNGSHLACEKIG